MLDKNILIAHLILFGIMVGRMVHFHSIENIITFGTFFFIGCLVFHNIINRMFGEKENHIFKS